MAASTAETPANPLEQVPTEPVAFRNPGKPAAGPAPTVPVVDEAPPAPAAPTPPAAPAQAPAFRNPGKVHRPVFKTLAKGIWGAPKKTADRVLAFRNPSALMRTPRATFGAVVSGVAGFGIGGGLGGASDYAMGWLGGKAGIASNPLFEPVTDIVRIGFAKGYLGTVVVPQVGAKTVHFLGGTVSKRAGKMGVNAGRGLWLGALINMGLDGFTTLVKYGNRAVNMLQGQPVAPAASAESSGLSLFGLGGLGELLKGTHQVGAQAAAAVDGTAATAHTASEPSTPAVAGVDGSDSTLLKELTAELGKNAQLRQLAAMNGQGTAVGATTSLLK